MPELATAQTSEPTPLSDPHGYLALNKFNRKLAQCPRTGVSVSYADVGDPGGIPVLFVPPSGCSRWFAAPQDPLAAGYGIRLIVVDRPGCGATPMVPLTSRIDVSCQHIASVLEHLDVKPAHMIATSAGVYHALRLLSAVPSIFKTSLSPPPRVYFISPWSPPLRATDPLAYRQLLDWIPDSVLTTQDTTLPYIIPAVKATEEAYGEATKAVGAAFGAVKSWWGGWSDKSSSVGSNPASIASKPPSIASVAASEKTPVHGEMDNTTGRESVPVPDEGAMPDQVEDEKQSNGEEDSEKLEQEEEPPKRRRLWAPSAKYLTMDYLYAEDFRGIGQEHMLCLNRGGADTGPEWFIREVAAVATAIRVEQLGQEKRKLQLEVWWGGLDGMVPKNGQEWLNKTLAAHPAEMAFSTHFVEDGDHSDLVMRAQGIGEVYMAIMTQGDTTSPPQIVSSEA